MAHEPIQHIPLDLVDPGPADDRRDKLDPDDLLGLSQSISRQGVLQPIIVRQSGDRYVTVAGRRRRDASRIAGRTSIPAIVRDLSDTAAWETSAAENLFRSNLSPLEEATTCATAIQDGKMSIEQVASAMGKSTRWVSDRLAMLMWPDDVIAAVHSGKLSVAAAGPLVGITPEATRQAIVAEAIRYGATARTTSAWAQSAASSRATGNNMSPNAASNSPPTQPTIPHSVCWCCGQTHPVTELSYLPTCSICYEQIPPAIQAANASDSRPTLPD